MMKKIVILGLIACFVQLSRAQQPDNLSESSDEACNQWVNNTLIRMGLNERVSQLFVYTLQPLNDSHTRKEVSRMMKKYPPGGIVFAKGKAEEQVKLTNYIQSIATVPVLVTYDDEWGPLATLDGMPSFPRRAALACITDNGLIESYNQELSRQLKELGMHSGLSQVAGSQAVQGLRHDKDMIIVAPGNLEKLQREILDAVQKGTITTQEIEAKCRRILTRKYLLGLSNHPQTIQPNGLEFRLNTPTAQELAARLTAASFTLLGNYGNILPLSSTAGDIAVVNFGPAGAGEAFLNSLGTYCKPAHYQVTTETTESEWQNILNSLKGSRRVIVSVTSEAGYETRPFLSRLEQLRPEAPMVYVFFGPPAAMFPATGPLYRASAIVVAHSATPEIQQRLPNLLFGMESFRGRMAVPLGRLFSVGSGVQLEPGAPATHIPEDYGMKSYIFHRGIDSIVTAGLKEDAYPGCQVLVMKNGQPLYDKSFGVHSAQDNTPVRPTDLFDLADLSQTTGTLLAVMKLYDEGKLKLTDRIAQFIPELRSNNKKNITIAELLFHESGLAPNIRFHREIIDDNSFYGPFTQGWADEVHGTRIGYLTWAASTFQFKKGMISPVESATHQLHVADNMWLNNSFRKTMISALANSTLDSKRYVYSPAGFILLQVAVENITGMPLDAYLEKEFYTPMNLNRTKYLPLRYYGKDEIMPTANNEYFRRQDLCGYVQDELAACQGGISGNAGLFSTAHEIGQIHQMLLNGGELNGKRYISQETCRLFTSQKSDISRRGLGFDKPSAFDPAAPLANPCSPSTPLEVFGHVGFTGTCAWADPVNNIVYVFLCNRMNPDVWNDKIVSMDIIQSIQELIYKSM